MWRRQQASIVSSTEFVLGRFRVGRNSGSLEFLCAMPPNSPTTQSYHPGMSFHLHSPRRNSHLKVNEDILYRILKCRPSMSNENSECCHRYGLYILYSVHLIENILHVDQMRLGCLKGVHGLTSMLVFSFV